MATNKNLFKIRPFDKPTTFDNGRFYFMEIWKDIPNYEGIYQVSNLGRVKSLKRISCIGRVIQEKILTLKDDNRGYDIISLCHDKKQKTFKVHQLVAVAFLNHTPNKLIKVVNHIDFNRKNNKSSNLEIITQRQNASLSHIKSSSKFVGVCWDKSKQRWLSRIEINGKQVYLGRFKNELDASNAYQHALNQIPYHRI